MGLNPSNFDDGKITVSVWGRFSQNLNEYRTLVSMLDPDQSSVIMEIGKQRSGFNNGSMELQLNGSRIISNKSGDFYSKGHWNHFCGVLDEGSGTARFYQNGVLQGDSSLNTTLQDASKIDLYIGRRYSNDRHHSNLIDDVRIYNESLSDAEVRDLYNWGARGRDLSDLVSDRV